MGRRGLGWVSNSQQPPRLVRPGKSYLFDIQLLIVLQVICNIIINYIANNMS